MSSGYLVLARKWRPQSFTELVGQEHAARAIQNALKSGRVPHAFLFTGIRGVGKTTIARLLAKCLNCETGVVPEPCGTCASCEAVAAGSHMDVMEIDAASRTKVDQMREVLDTVRYAPTASRFKVYIVDEVHMLSIPSFNALLKTLEEPPPHVKFIFATTDPQKIPATILSRCQHFDLKRITRTELAAYLEKILKEEVIEFDAPGLAAVVQAADGSVRDALSLLEQVIAHGGGAVRFEAVGALLGLTDRSASRALLGHLLQGEAAQVLETAAAFHASGVDPSHLVGDLLDLVHHAARFKVMGEQEGAALEDEGLSDLKGLADRSSMEHLQMAYQILLRGLADVKGAEAPAAALEMLLLRLAYLRPIPGLERVIKSLREAPPFPPARPADPPLSGGASRRAPQERGGDPRPEPPPLAAPSAPVSSAPAPESPQPAREAASGPVNPPPSSGELPRQDPEAENINLPEKVDLKELTSWEQLVSFIGYVAPQQKVKLEQIALVKRFSPGTPEKGPEIEFALTRDHFGSPAENRRWMLEFLASKGFVNASVKVEMSRAGEARGETLHEQAVRKRSDYDAALESEIREHPLVRELNERFEGELIRVDHLREPGKLNEGG